MSATITLKGGEELQEKLSTLAMKVGHAVRVQLNLGALKIQRDAQKDINNKSHGEQRIRYSANGNKRTVVVSNPYDSPNSDTGNLRKRIVISKGTGTLNKGYSVRVRSLAIYAKALEYGYAKRNLKPRPYMGPALLKNELTIYRNVKLAVRKELNK